MSFSSIQLRGEKLGVFEVVIIASVGRSFEVARMNARFLLTMMLPLVTAACSIRMSQPAHDAEAIRALDAGWARSYQVHDTAYAIQLFADDLVVTATNGALKTKQGELADIRPNPSVKMDYFRTSDVKIRMLDGGAVVTGLAQWSFTSNGRPSQVARRYTAVYARGGPLGSQMVALHIGRAPE
jgi:ketosteroid isomerase-like protein